MDEVIICVAPCPGDNQKERFPGKMDVPEEVRRSYDAGASLVHLHVRDEEGCQTTDTTIFQAQVKKIRAVTRLVIEGSTGGTPEHTLAQRCVSLAVPGIEMGSLNMGSVNMAGGVYQNPMSDIRHYAAEMQKNHIKPSMIVFDLSMIYTADRLKEDGLLAEPLVYNLVLDVPEALPFSPKILGFLVDQLPWDGVWFLIRHHAPGRRGFQEALEMGGHVRVGYEDGPFLHNGQRARSNAELVEEIAGAAREAGRRVVDCERAREILGISR